MEVIERIGATVAERRGLALLDEVPVYLLRRADIPAFLEADEEVSAHEDAFDAGTDDDADQRIFALLGLIGDDVSLDDLFEDFFVGLGLGFYDFDLQGFVIISANDHVAGGDVATITHEFVHVLQDQHFAISDYFEAHRDNQDRILAARFVVEGDATNAERLFRDIERELASRLEPRRDRAPGLSASVPPLLQAIFTAPYISGARVIAQVLQAEGLAGVDALLAEFPPSTEQLLHPDKLAAGEPPLDVDDPDVIGVLGEAWEPVGSDTLGEFMLRTLLGPATGADLATRAAAGWGGDRLTAYRGPADMSMLVWELRWDTAADAEEMTAALRHWLPARTGAPVQELAPGTELRSQGAARLGLGAALGRRRIRRDRRGCGGRRAGGVGRAALIAARWPAAQTRRRKTCTLADSKTIACRTRWRSLEKVWSCAASSSNCSNSCSESNCATISTWLAGPVMESQMAKSASMPRAA